MIRLQQDELQSMYPQMSAAFSERMGRMIRQLPAVKEEKQVKKPSLRMILIAVMIILTMSTTAIALTRSAVLDWLLVHNAPVNPQLEQTVQKVTASATAEGVTVHITGAVHDGTELAFSYAIENADPTQPVIAALDSTFCINGQATQLPHPVYSYNVRMVPSPHLDVLPAQRNPATGGVWAKLPAGLHGQAECAVTFIVYRPEKAFAVLISPEDALLDTTITDAAFLAEIADARATLESFRNAILVEAEETAAESWALQGYTPVYDWGDPIFDATDARSHLTEITRITVPFTIDMDNAISHDFSGTQAEFADFTVRAESFRLTPLRTYADVHLLPKDNTKSAAAALAERFGEFTLTDEHGQPVVYSDMDYLADFHPYVTCMDGQWVCRYLMEMPGLLSFPQSVGFTVNTGDLLRFELNIPE